MIADKIANKMIRLIAAALFLAAAPVAARADNNTINITLDEAVPLRLAAPAEGVAIGNPSIAGVSVQNEQLIFVTGRSYGSTNLVVVGADGRVLYSGRITVTANEDGSVMVTRGLNTQRLECAPTCRPRPDIGDSALESTLEQIAGRANSANAGSR